MFNCEFSETIIQNLRQYRKRNRQLEIAFEECSRKFLKMKHDLTSKKEAIRVLQKSKSFLEQELFSLQSARFHAEGEQKQVLNSRMQEMQTLEKDYKNRLYLAEMTSAKALRRAQNAEKKLHTSSEFRLFYQLFQTGICLQERSTSTLIMEITKLPIKCGH